MPPPPPSPPPPASIMFYLSTGLLVLSAVGHPAGDGDQGHQAWEHHSPVQDLELLLLYLNIFVNIIVNALFTAVYYESFCQKKETYNFSLWHVIKHDEVTEHRDEADETETRHNVDHCILQTELSCNKYSAVLIQLNVKPQNWILSLWQCP